VPEKAHFGQKGQKKGFWAKKPDFGVFRGFRPPWALPGRRRGGCFYINPSRRGPVAPPGGSGKGQPRPGAG